MRNHYNEYFIMTYQLWVFQGKWFFPTFVEIYTYNVFIINISVKLQIHNPKFLKKQNHKSSMQIQY